MNMVKYIAEIIIKYKDPYLCPIKKIHNKNFEDFDKTLFGKYEGLRLRGKGVDLLDKNVLYTFEVNDEDLKEGNQKHLKNNIDYTRNEILGKNVKIGDEYIEDSEDYIHLKKINEDSDLTELFIVDSDIKLNQIYKYMKNIPLLKKPITNTIYLTDCVNVIGPFSWECPNKDNFYFDLTPFNSTDYMVNVYLYNDIRDFISSIKADLDTFENLMLTENIPTKSNNRQDCMPIENIVKQFFQNSTESLTKTTINELDFSQERKNRLYKLLEKQDANDKLREDFLNQIAQNDYIWDELIQIKNDKNEDSEKLEQLTQENEKIRKDRDDKNSEIENLKKQNEKLLEDNKQYKELQTQQEISNINKDLLNENSELTQQKEKLEEETTKLKKDLDDLKYNTRNTLEKFDGMLNDRFSKLSQTAIDNTVDTQIIGKILKVASQQNTNAITDNILIHQYNEHNKNCIMYKHPKDLLNDLFDKFKQVRKKYTKNDIANIILCISLGFLTIFAGEPGTGKTSCVKYLAKFLGLTGNKDNNDNEIKRYVEVAVEKGWSSKKDLLGFYNSLTKDFNTNNQELYNGFLQLKKEEKENIEDFPFFILLDEANLSPMEYYWADFMKACDYQNTELCKINLYEGFDFVIPKYLKFLATINLDHTTEILSPRLIDRSWIIKLPSSDYSIEDNFLNVENNKNYPMVATNVFADIIGATLDKDYSFKDSVKNKFDKIQETFKKVNIKFSPRIISMIRNYCIAADKLELMDTNTNELTAFDYAIAQKILPMINGQGKNFETLVDDLENLTKDKMPKSNKIITEIKNDGKNNGMEYYQYFAR